MYPPIVNSPKTELSELITDTQTEITVANASVLLQGEGIAVIGNGDVAETITYTSVEDNVLKGCVRGYEGVARAWPVGTRIARNFTAADFRTVQDNINEIDNKVTTLNTTVVEKTQNASLTKKGITQLSEAVDGTRNDIAATESAIKKAYDLANSRETPAGAQAKANTAETNAKNASFPKSGGRLTGDGPMISLVGTTHAYIEFFPKGVSEGRKAYLGFGDPGKLDVNFVADSGELSFADMNGRVGLKTIMDMYTGNGSPEGAVSAYPGSLYRRRDGGPGSTLYVKEGGAGGNTGWRAL
ncbi:phage tail protein [Paenibacillus sp. T2-29]